MAERRDELDAYVFARKRIVAAFLRGGDAASDRDAPQPVRAFLASLALGVLLLAGYGLWGLATQDTPPNGWQQDIIVDRQTGSRYVSIESPGNDAVLRPVLNLASARLAKPEKTPVVLVSHAAVLAERRGTALGIPGAPDTLPDSVPPVREWTACSAADAAGQPEQTLLVGVAVKPARLAGGADRQVAAFVRTADGARWVVVAGHRFPVRSDAELRGFVHTAAAALDPELVNQSWLALFTPGTPIDGPSLAGFGGAASTNLPAGLNRIGTVVQVRGLDGQRYVVTGQGLATVTETVADVLMDDPRNQQNTGDARWISKTEADRARTAAPYGPGDWPQRPVDVANTAVARTVCVQDPTPLGPAGSAAAPLLSFDSKLPDERAARDRSPVRGVAEPSYVYVRPGSATFAQAAVGSSDGALYLVSGTGTRYQLWPADPDPKVGPVPLSAEGTAKQLGMSGPPARVSPSWLALLRGGPYLNQSAACQQAASG